MIENPSYGFASSDPNTQRVIEELANVLNDVELRLHVVRVGLAQAFPHLAANLAGNRGIPPHLAMHGAIPGFQGIPFAQPFGSQTSAFPAPMGFPTGQPLPQGFGGIPFATPGHPPLTSPGLPQSQTPFVNAPLGSPSVPFAPFRW